MCTPNTHYTRMAFGDTVVNFGSGKRWVLTPQATDKCGALVMTPVEDLTLPVGAVVNEDDVDQVDALTVLHFAEIKNVDVMIDTLVILRDKMKAKAEKSKEDIVSPESLHTGKMLDPVALLEALFPPTSPVDPKLMMFLKAQVQKASDSATPDEEMLAEFRRAYGQGIL